MRDFAEEPVAEKPATSLPHSGAKNRRGQPLGRPRPRRFSGGERTRRRRRRASSALRPLTSPTLTKGVPPRPRLPYLLARAPRDRPSCRSDQRIAAQGWQRVCLHRSAGSGRESARRFLSPSGPSCRRAPSPDAHTTEAGRGCASCLLRFDGRTSSAGEAPPRADQAEATDLPITGDQPGLDFRR